MIHPEAAIIEALRNADPRRQDHHSPALKALFGAFVIQHQAKLRSYCGRYGPAGRADEIAQDTWVDAWRKLDGFRGDSTLWTWVRGIAKYHCKNATRKQKDLLTADGVIEATAEGASVLHTLHREERVNLVRDALAQQTELAQRIAIYRYADGLSYRAIAEVLDLDHDKAVKNELQKMKLHLGRALHQQLQAMDEQTSWIRSL